MENKKQEPEKLYKELKELIPKIRVWNLKKDEFPKKAFSYYPVSAEMARAKEILKELTVEKHPDFFKTLPLGEKTEIKKYYEWLSD